MAILSAAVSEGLSTVVIQTPSPLLPGTARSGFLWGSYELYGSRNEA